MPYLNVQTNIADAAISDDFIKRLSVLVAQLLNKPEQYVAVQISAAQRLFFSGTNEPAAILELTSIGLEINQTKHLSHELMNFLQVELGISTERIYIRFVDFAGHMIGWNKDTF
jgi:phenylpyruvate tautomerase